MEFLKKLTELAHDVSIGLARQYRDKTIEYAKIKAATYYAEGMRVLRKQFILLLSLIFCLLLTCVSLVVIPTAIIALMPWTRELKLLSVAIYGVFVLLAPVAALLYVLSEKKWLEMTKSNEFLEKALHGD